MTMPPRAYNKTTSFTDYATNNPSGPLPGSQLDVEFTNLEHSVDDLTADLALIQRSDGALTNGIVTPDGLSQPVLALIAGKGTVRGAWAGTTSYVISDLASLNGATYICLTTHTSAVFATDLAAGKWMLFSAPSSLATTPFYQRLSGTGASVAYTLTQSFGTNSNEVEVYVNGLRTDPTLYTLSATTLTGSFASGTNNVLVYAPSSVVSQGALNATNSAAAALVSGNAAAASAVTAAAQAVISAAQAVAAAASASDATANGAAQVVLAAAQVALAAIQAGNAATSATQSQNYIAGLAASSTTSLAVGTGSKSLTIQTAKNLTAGQFVTITSSANSANFMHGAVTSYNSGTGALVANVLDVGGSGTVAAWDVAISGPQGVAGPTGPTGASGAGTGDMLAANNLSDLVNAATARSNLGVVIGTDVQAYDATILKSAAIGVSVQAYDATILKSAAIGSTVQAYSANIVQKNAANTYSAPQTPTAQTLTDAATVTIAISQQIWNLTLTAARIMGAPSGGTTGTTYRLVLTSAGFTPSWNTVFKFPGGTVPSSLTGTCVFDFYYDGTNFLCIGQNVGEA